MKHTVPLESATRKKIDQILNNLGWVTDEFSLNCNVFTERTKTKEQNNLLKKKSGYKKPPDYVLYKSGTNSIIAIIEAKRIGQSLDDALKQAITNYAEPLNVDIIFVTDGIIVQSYDRRVKDNLFVDDQIVVDFLSEKMILSFIDQSHKIYSSTKFAHTKRELIQIFADANEILREEGMRQGIERFTEFSNLLFLKLVNEKEEEREANGEKRILEKKYCWDSFYKKEPDEMLEYINKIVLPKLVQRYNHSGDVFQKELGIKTPENLKNIVDKLSSLKLHDTDSDVKGDAFEYFLKNSITVGKDLGEHFTPRHIVKLMVELVNPNFGDKVYDPCCGTGGFLIEAFKHIKSKIKHTKDNLTQLENDTIYGRELTATAKIAKMNMIISGDGHTNIEQKDSLKFPLKEKYETILTNFPFSQKTRYSSLYGFTSETANPVFLKHAMDALVDKGRAGVIVPDGLLFDKDSEYVKLRKSLLDTCNVIAIIQLDPFVFAPYTKQPTCIVIFEKGKQTKDIWFFDVIDDGFKKSGSKKGRVPFEKNDLKLLREIWSDKADSKRSFSVSYDTIKKNHYKLTMNSYKKKITRKVPVEPLSGICEEPMLGATPPRNNRECWKGKNLWVSIADMTKKYIDDTKEKITDKGIEISSVKKLPKETLLFSFKLSVGKVAFAGKPLYTNEAIVGLVPKDKNDNYMSKYLYYILPMIDYTPYAQRATKGITLNKESIGDIEIPIPPPSIRKKIVDEAENNEKKKHDLIKQVTKIDNSQAKFIRQCTM